ncbi:hypothetical protein [Amycolatopsis sp. NPDC021455]
MTTTSVVGKTGRRMAERLRKRGVGVSRRGVPRFDRGIWAR